MVENEEGRRLFMTELRQALGSMEELPDDLESTAEVGGQRLRKRLGYPLDREKMTGNLMVL